MLEKPNLHDELIVACLEIDFTLSVSSITFLPLGADLNTAVYRAVADDGQPYFVKLRRGVFDETSVALPRFLSEQGIKPIIAPLPAQTGKLWAELGAFKLILYPFIAGHDGYEVKMSERHWRDFGTALKRIHTAAVPPALCGRIRQEEYSPTYRAAVKSFLDRIEEDSFDDPVAVEVAAFLRSKQGEIRDLVRRAERLALALQARSPEFIVCHSDIHAGNIFIGVADTFYIVDWDEPIRAPKERDLMYIGGALLGRWRTAEEEEALFYPAYGQTEIDPRAMAYYRYERIIEDIAIYCEQLLLTDEGGDDRQQSLGYLKSNFLPGHTIETAYKTDRTA